MRWKKRDIRRNKRGLTKGTAVGILAAYCIIWGATIGVLYYGWAYPSYFYPMDKALDWLDLAGATSNLHEIAADLNTTYSFLVPFHGNPQWWYPTPNTDFDLIKADIQTTVLIAVNVSHNGTQSYSYQQTVQTLHGSTIPNLYTRVQDAENYYSNSVKTSPGQVGLIEGGLSVGLGVLLIVFLVTRDYD